MDYEQKYKKALEKAQKELQSCGSKDCDAVRQIYRFFPELKESEDERIRKSIIAIINNYVDNSNTFKPKMIAWLEKQGEQNLASSAKISKNEDTFLDLLNKMPSCITVDGVDYHFVMKKTSIYIAYYACYNGNGEEGRGNAIFGITAHSPIDLLTEILEILKEKGLL